MTESGAQSVLQRVDDLRTVGRFTDAEQLLRQALAAEPHDAHLLWRLGAVLLRLERYDEGIEVARAAVAADPANSNGHRIHAMLLAGHGMATEAVTAAEAALDLAPDHAHTVVVYSYVLQCAHRHAESSTTARRAVGMAPHDPEAHLRLGDAAWATGDRATARQSYLEALRLDPEHAKASRQLALLDAGRHPGRALRRLITTGRHRPDLPGLLGTVATLSWRIGARLRSGLLFAALPVLLLGGRWDDGIAAGSWTVRIAALVVLAAAAGFLWREARHLPGNARPVLVAALRSSAPLRVQWVAIALSLAGFVVVAITGVGVFAAAIWVIGVVVSWPVCNFVGSLFWPLGSRDSASELPVAEFLNQCTIQLRVALCFAALFVVAVGDPTKKDEPAVATTSARVAAVVLIAVAVVVIWRGCRRLPEQPVRAVLGALRASGPLVFKWLTVFAALGILLTVAFTGLAPRALYVWPVVLLSTIVLAANSWTERRAAPTSAAAP